MYSKIIFNTYVLMVCLCILPSYKHFKTMITNIIMELHEVNNKYKKANITIKNNFVISNNNFILNIRKLLLWPGLCIK